MKMLTFAGRNFKEILRDPLNLAFGLGFPLAVLLLLSAIQANIPLPLFEINNLTPGITVFGLAERLEISRDEAKQLIEGYFESFPKVKEYMEKARISLRQTWEST